MKRQYRKSDIEFHSNGYRDSHPAINVRVYAILLDGWADMRKYESNAIDEGFTPEWLEAYAAKRAGIVPDPEYGYGVGETDEAVDRLVEGWWADACEVQFEAAVSDTEHFFGQALNCSLAGRSGGWLIVDDFRADDVETWDAIMVARWGRFEKACKAYAREVPFQMLMLIYLNVFEVEREREQQVIEEMKA